MLRAALLLVCLSSTAFAGSVKGTVLFEGEPPTQDTLKRDSDQKCSKDKADEAVVVTKGKLRDVVVRIKNGSGGTHNGLRSIVDRLGTREFPRLRLGVGRGDARRDLADHVLSRFEPGERAELESFIARAADAAEMFIEGDIGGMMNKYNPEPPEPDND